MSRVGGNQLAPDGDSFGWPLFASTVTDVELISGERGSDKAFGVEPLFGVLSLPVDFAVDAVLLPFDVVAGCFGSRKRGWAVDRD